MQATHIFDGLESWPTHIMYLSGGRLQLFAPTAELPEMHDSGLLTLVERCATKNCRRSQGLQYAPSQYWDWTAEAAQLPSLHRHRSMHASKVLTFMHAACQLPVVNKLRKHFAHGSPMETPGFAPLDRQIFLFVMCCVTFGADGYGRRSSSASRSSSTQESSIRRPCLPAVCPSGAMAMHLGA